VGPAPGFARQVAQAEVVVAQAELEQAQVRLTHTDIRAPIDGTVLKLNVGVGSFTNPETFGLASTASICELADLTALEVEVSIHERNLARFFKGQRCEARLDAFPETTYRGVVDRLSPTVDRGQGTFTLWVKLELPKKDHNLPIDACTRVRFVPR
jgi:multidrug resistance efflux pump